MENKLEGHVGGLRVGVPVTQQIYPRKHTRMLSAVLVTEDTFRGHGPPHTEEPSLAVTVNAPRCRDVHA